MLSRALKEDPVCCPALSSADINDGQRGIVLHLTISPCASLTLAEYDLGNELHARKARG